MPQKSSKLGPSKLTGVIKAQAKKFAKIALPKVRVRLPRVKIPKIAAKSLAKSQAKTSAKAAIESPAKKPLKLTENDLINAESALGSRIFGAVPAGHRREFFLYKHNVWMFHESWIENGKRKETTITFTVRETGVYKNPLRGGYDKISGEELDNFCAAVRKYYQLVKNQLYQ